MANRFSKELLRQLRNDIPVNILIAEILDIPTKISEGYVRFLCPICREFNTAINPKTNLGRCFCCNKNYNPIDIVMTVKHLNFKEAAQFLINIKKI
ncbi:MAG: CHC2 zinc finger domain-containing protein [bacterium]